MTARLADLENALVVQVQTEATFVQVLNPSNPAFGNPTLAPNVSISIHSGKTVDRGAVAGNLYVTKRIEFTTIIGTRIAGGAPGDSRLVAGGIHDLYDKLQAKLLGFVPAISLAPQAVFPCYEEDFFIDRLEDGAVDLYVLWSVDLKLQAPIQ